jgi:alpha-L-rhamnosidase
MLSSRTALPQVVGNLTSVTASNDSIHGRIVSEWKRETGTLTIEVTIPFNTTATVYVPAKDEMSVTEGASPIRAADHVEFLRMESGNAVLGVNPGRYRFVSHWP